MAISRPLQPRQQYGLGSFVKKITRGVKKVAKSKLGKAALLYAGTAGLGALAGGAGGTGFGWKMFNPASIGRNFGTLSRFLPGASKMPAFLTRGMGGTPAKSGMFGSALKWMGANPGKTAMLGLGAAGMAAPFFAGKPEEEEEESDWSVTPSSIANIRNMARNRDQSLAFMPQNQYVQSGYYLADGGLASLANGGNPAEAQAEQMLKMEYQKYRNQGGTMSYQQFKMAVLQQAQGQGPMAQGQQGPQGYANGELVTDESMVEATPAGMMEENIEEVQGEPTREQLEALAMEIFQLRLEELDEEQLMVVYQTAMEQQPQEEAVQEDIQFANRGGRIGKDEGGLMNLGGMEKDYRQEGGFVPLGKKEKADDVPARLSKNEFVFTADAVRNAGGGDIDQGAEVMQNMMNNLESGGQISEDSQGAQGMYNNMKQLETRVG